MGDNKSKVWPVSSLDLFTSRVLSSNYLSVARLENRSKIVIKVEWKTIKQTSYLLLELSVSYYRTSYRTYGKSIENGDENRMENTE